MTTLRSITKSINISFLYGLTRCYSVYPPTYIRPIFKKDQQDEILSTEEGRHIIHSYIKPAFSHESCSELYDEVTSKFTSYIMRKGKKQLARTLLEDAFENIKRIQLERYHKSNPEKRDEIELDPKSILAGAVENCTPLMEFRKIRKGGIKYQVPVPMNPNRARFLSMNWLIRAAKQKERSIHFPEHLAKELIDAYYNRGTVVKQKLDLHKKCEENRAYAHFRWT